MIPLYKLIIGTANWFNDYNGTYVTEKQAEEIIEYAKKVGIMEYDTARSYAGGRTEKYLATIPDIKVYTKGDTYEEMENSINMFKEKLVGYLIHHPSLNYPYYQKMRLDCPVSFGISGYDIREIKEFCRNIKTDICQIPYNEFDKEEEIETSVIIRKIYPYIKNIGYTKDYWDRAVIGIDNVEQLKEIVEIWRTL